jgi:hypothetical protein
VIQQQRALLLHRLSTTMHDGLVACGHDIPLVVFSFKFTVLTPSRAGKKSLK